MLMFSSLYKCTHTTHQTLRNYVKFLFLQTGTVVSKSTISRFFVHGFPIQGSMCKPNLIPFDKFRPANFEKALIYMHIVSCIVLCWCIMHYAISKVAC